MTDSLLPLSDEDLSAVFDGEASSDVASRAAADPVAQARLAAIRDVVKAVQEHAVTPLGEDAVDQLVARALSSAEKVASIDHLRHDGTDGLVVPLPTPSGRRTPPNWLVAAAVVALMAIGVGLVWSGQADRGTDTIAASTNGETLQKSDLSEAGAMDYLDPQNRTNYQLDSGAPSTTGVGGPHGLETTTARSKADQAVAMLVELGTFAEAAALRTALKTSFPSDIGTAHPTARVSPTNLQVNRCQAQIQNILTITSNASQVGLALVAGTPVLVYEFPATTVTGSTPATLVAAVALDTCTQVFTFQR